MIYLHNIRETDCYGKEKQFIHRDLKAANLLISNDGSIKITDFGLSKFSAELTTTFCGTLTHIAPEIMTSRIKYGQKVDVYSFAIMVWEIFNCEEPFDSIVDDHDLMHEVVTQNHRTPLDNGKCPIEMVSIVRKCWMTNPEDRPSFAELVVDLNTMFSNKALMEFYSSKYIGKI